MVLKASHLAKSYKSRKVVKNVSFSVERGQIVGLLGPNGAGKTTCFYMIVGIIPPDHGKIFIDQQEITPLPVHKRAQRGIGYLPQEASIFRKLTVEDNLKAILETQKGKTKKDIQSEAQALMKEFNIFHLANTKGMSLSGGERRRVEIARALSANPQYILLDEPFAGVDPISINDIKQIILHLQNKAIGVLITDHNVRETLDICEQAYIVGEGHIIAQGSADQVLSNQQVRNTYLGAEFKL